MNDQIPSPEKAASLLADNILSFLDYFDVDYERSLLSAGKSHEEAVRLVGWDWTHGIGVYALYRLATKQKDARLLHHIRTWFNQRIAAGLPEKCQYGLSPADACISVW